MKFIEWLKYTFIFIIITDYMKSCYEDYQYKLNIDIKNDEYKHYSLKFLKTLNFGLFFVLKVCMFIGFIYIIFVEGQLNCLIK